MPICRWLPLVQIHHPASPALQFQNLPGVAGIAGLHHHLDHAAFRQPHGTLRMCSKTSSYPEDNLALLGIPAVCTAMIIRRPVASLPDAVFASPLRHRHSTAINKRSMKFTKNKGNKMSPVDGPLDKGQGVEPLQKIDGLEPLGALRGDKRGHRLTLSPQNKSHVVLALIAIIATMAVITDLESLIIWLGDGQSWDDREYWSGVAHKTRILTVPFIGVGIWVSIRFMLDKIIISAFSADVKLHKRYYSTHVFVVLIGFILGAIVAGGVFSIFVDLGSLQKSGIYNFITLSSGIFLVYYYLFWNIQDFLESLGRKFSSLAGRTGASGKISSDRSLGEVVIAANSSESVQSDVGRTANDTTDPVDEANSRREEMRQNIRSAVLDTASSSATVMTLVICFFGFLLGCLVPVVGPGVGLAVAFSLWYFLKLRIKKYYLKSAVEAVRCGQCNSDFALFSRVVNEEIRYAVPKSKIENNIRATWTEVSYTETHRIDCVACGDIKFIKEDKTRRENGETQHL